MRRVTVPACPGCYSDFRHNKNKAATVLPSARLVPVDCSRLQLGMFVAELDRPWLQTPYLTHGFLLCHAEQLDELRRLCAYVYVDPALSEHGEEALFSTGLTARLEALSPDELPLTRSRQHLRHLGHAFADAVRRAHRLEALPLVALRRAVAPVVSELLKDPDTLPWLMATELRVGYLHRRALGCAVLMAVAGHRIGFERPTLDELALAGLLLDIGKTSVPVPILAKAGPLSGEERGFVHRHVRRGLYLLRAAATLSEPLEEALLGHHERLDGSGYPRGQKGTDIPLAARLAAVVDTYDAVMQDRRYASARAAHDAVRLVHRLRHQKFDASIVRSFSRALGLYPTGSWVQLADGRLGVVRRQVAEEPARPLVGLVSDSAGRALPPEPRLWQPLRRTDIVSAIAPGRVHIPPPVVAQALQAAASLAA